MDAILKDAQAVAQRQDKDLDNNEFFDMMNGMTKADLEASNNYLPSAREMQKKKKGGLRSFG